VKVLKMPKRSFFVLLLIAVTLVGSGVIFVTTAADDQTALAPIRTSGDKWTLSVNYQLPFGMIGTMTNEITSTSVSVGGYDCTEFIGTGGGPYSGQGNTGSWTINGTLYETKIDYSQVKSESTLDTKTTSFNETVVTVTENNPPLNNVAFPIFVGKNWTCKTTQLFNNQHILNGALTKGNSSQPATFNFSVLRSEKVTVPAGEFQTFVIKKVLIDNTANNGTSSEIYYSAKAHNTVKEFDYLPNGHLAFSLELLNYSVSEPTPTPTTITSDPSASPTPSAIATLPSSPTPTAPELSWLALLPLLLSVFSVALVLRHRKQVKKL
jgi:hypothetical protein